MIEVLVRRPRELQAFFRLAPLPGLLLVSLLGVACMSAGPRGPGSGSGGAAGETDTGGKPGTGGSPAGGKGGSPAGGSGGAPDPGGTGGLGDTGGSGGAAQTGGAGGGGSGDGGAGSSGGGGSPAGGSGGEAGAGGGAGMAGGAGGMTPNAYKIYVGQTHAHSQLSTKSHDGIGPDGPAAGFAKAKAAGADFYFITDHVDYGPISPADFATVKAAAEAATTPTFVALAGIEFHLSIHNEMNSFAIELDTEHVGKATKVTGYQYADFLRMKYPGAYAQWTHPLRSGLENHEYKGRTAARDEVIALLEVLNGDDDPMESAYHQALNEGWHIGPTAGHDNHGEDWFTLPTRTGVLATSLTRDNIHDGIRQSRVFCSQDSKMRVWYDLNGTIMGATTPVAASYKATVRVEGTTATNIELITKGGMVAASGKPTGGVWTANLTGVTAGSFYYARLTSSGGKTWTAPVWVQ